MNILSIDPSINFCGYAIFNNKKLKQYALLKPKKTDKTLIDKCKTLYTRVRQLMHEYKINELVIEIPEHWRVAGFVARESGSMYKLTFVCGVFIACTFEQNIKLTTYYPREWKGQMTKHIVANRLQSTYKDITEINHNIADAICIGHHRLFGTL